MASIILNSFNNQIKLTFWTRNCTCFWFWVPTVFQIKTSHSYKFFQAFLKTGRSLIFKTAWNPTISGTLPRPFMLKKQASTKCAARRQHKNAICACEVRPGSKQEQAVTKNQSSEHAQSWSFLTKCWSLYPYDKHCFIWKIVQVTLEIITTNL